MTPDRPQNRETDWLWNELNTLREQITDQHRRIRDDMNIGFSKVSHEVKEGLRGVDQRLGDHSGRLIVIETERGIEKNQAVKRGTWAGLAAASGFSLVAEFIKHYLTGGPK